MPTPDLAAAHWFTTSRSTSNGDCVECAVLPDVMAARDSKHRSGPTLAFRPASGSAFIAATTPAPSPRRSRLNVGIADLGSKRPFQGPKSSKIYPISAASRTVRTVGGWAVDAVMVDAVMVDMVGLEDE
ncbi:DUF397 domain-containing protein [Micromonospora sp. NBC_01405]|uniref:DUF397 domain-containing protein n=1 Tax=Micromonospora sp. NBC_01405 TaxID=2903589 RepID=UPI00386F66B3